MQNPLIAKLRKIVDLGEADRQALEGVCEETRHVARHTDIISDGDSTEYVHLILEGWAYRYQVLKDGARQITAFLIPGDFCDMHVAVLGEMDHSIGTLTPTKVAYIPHKHLSALLERPQIARAFWWATLVDEAVLRAWIVNVGRRDAFDRIAHILCELQLRLASVGMVDGGSFDLPLTQEELADAAGITPVHTNRVLKRLCSEGLIEYERENMTILDVQRLKDVSGFDPRYLHLKGDFTPTGER
jgi:CRP-like cAMP-binding protein